MQAFERIVHSIYSAHGWWLKSNVRVRISSRIAEDNGVAPAEVELDLVALLPATQFHLNQVDEPSKKCEEVAANNTRVRIIECKSFIFSPKQNNTAVDLRTFDRPKKNRYRTLRSPKLRLAVAAQLKVDGVIPQDSETEFVLASLATKGTDHDELLSRLKTSGLVLHNRKWLEEQFAWIAQSGRYVDDVTITLAVSGCSPCSGNWK